MMIRRVSAIIGLTLVAAMIVNAICDTSNCGGNSAAIAAVKSVACIAFLEAKEEEDTSFNFVGYRGKYRLDLLDATGPFLSPEVQILVTAARIDLSRPLEEQLIAVCDTPFRNVPKRHLFRPPPTHAAAYADGSIRLFSVAEFDALDKSQFLPIAELVAVTNGEANHGATVRQNNRD